MKSYIVFMTSCIVLLVLTAPSFGQAASLGGSASEPLVLSHDGGWCWFESPRAIVSNGKLVVGSVASGASDPSRRGDIEALVYDFQTGKAVSVELFDRLQLDDHDSPAFHERPDGSLLAVFAKHGPENHFYYRISAPGNFEDWGPVMQFSPSESSRITYSNVYRLPSENNRIFNFFRGLDNSYKPSYVYSDDLGQSWVKGNVFIQVPSTVRHRPYVRYASNGEDSIHFAYTEGHPRDYDNSIYHVWYRKGQLHQSDGTPIAALKTGLTRPEDGTLVYKGDADHVAWIVDLKVYSDESLAAVFSVQLNSNGLPKGEGGDNIQYRYARWEGRSWNEMALAHAGTRLYAGEDDYSGLAALDPDNPNIVYISTDADPITGAPLISQRDAQRHYEIYRGTRVDSGAAWTWEALTMNSILDNLRPIVPAREQGKTVLLWLRGTYRAYRDYEQEVVGILLPQE